LLLLGEELGGANLHCSVSGVADYFASSEEESFQMARDCVQSLNLKVTKDSLAAQRM